MTDKKPVKKTRSPSKWPKVPKTGMKQAPPELYEPSEKDVYELATELYGRGRAKFKGFGAKITEARELLIDAHKTGEPVKAPELSAHAAGAVYVERPRLVEKN